MKRIFVSFAMEDKFARDNLTYQSKQENTPFDFVDMSVKEPWSSSWKTQCRERIKSCDGVVAFVSDNTINADGALWEIKCAYEESIPVFPVYIHDEGVKRIPSELSGRRIYHWTWPNITNFINSL
ncbi:MAG: hypothetical protein NUV53_03040 [Patescibacteria group bacterium]|nr:hypothetical protein [Patescibacteria group bacterium]